MQSITARSTVSVCPYRYTSVRVQIAAAARAAGRPSLRPFNAGRPRLPVRAGGGPNSAALAGSRVVHVTPAASSAVPW
jgi:hypothetical protein